MRNNFLKKKLGLTNSDEELDKAIMLAAEKMKGDRAKNRVTVFTCSPTISESCRCSVDFARILSPDSTVTAFPASQSDWLAGFRR